MGTVKIDSASWPVTVFTLEGECDERLIEAFVDGIVAAAKRGTPFANIIDLRAATDFTAARRRYYSDRLNAAKEIWEPNFAGSAIIVESALMRGVLTAVNWVSEQKMAYVQNMREAERAAKAALRKVGVEWPGLKA